MVRRRNLRTERVSWEAFGAFAGPGSLESKPVYCVMLLSVYTVAAMTRGLRAIFSAFIVVVLATAAVIPGRVLCIMSSGEARVEGMGECELFNAASDTPSLFASASCIDISLVAHFEARPESLKDVALPPLALRDVVSLVKQVITDQRHEPFFSSVSPPILATPTRTVVLLI